MDAARPGLASGQAAADLADIETDLRGEQGLAGYEEWSVEVLLLGRGDGASGECNYEAV
jgi:hypothetical protein